MARHHHDGRRRYLSTTEGTSAAAFGGIDWLLFLFVALAWGSSFLFIDVALEDLDPGVVTFGRIGLGAIALALAPVERTRIERADWPRVLALGLMWIAVPETLLPIAQQWINSAVTGMLVGAVPILTALIGMGLLGRLPGRPQQAGMVVGVVGIVCIGIPSANAGDTAFAGVLAVLVAAGLYALSANLVAPLQQTYGSATVMRPIIATGAVLTAPYAALGLNSSSLTWSAVASLAALGLAATATAFVAYGSLIGRVGATRASAVTYVIPVAALALGVSLRGDNVDQLGYLGCACVVAATALVSRHGR